MTKRKPSTATQDVGATPCLKCKSNVNDDDDSAVSCELCETWMHGACCNLPTAVTDYFNTAGYRSAKFRLPFICQICRPTFEQLKSLPAKFDFLEARFTALEKRFDSHSTAPQQFDTASIAELIKDAVEVDSKKANAVLFGVTEADGVDDTSTVRQIVADANLADLKPQDILRTFRDGPKHQGKPRFLKVICSNSQAKRAFIAHVNGKRRFDDAYPLRARPDLSWLQRKRSRELQTELFDRKRLGEKGLFIDYRNDCIRSHDMLSNSTKPK
jgi:hypothetical protein